MQEVKFYQGFTGYFNSIIYLNKVLNEDYAVLLKRFKYGLYSEKHLRDLQKFANPNFLSNSEVEMVESVELKECDAFTTIVENIKFLYLPVRVTNSGT